MTKILALDTATEQCSVALATEGGVIERVVPTARGHADLVLPLIEEVLRESGIGLKQLDGLAFGRGPGSFTGVRIAVGVIQGLALSVRLPVVGVSNLAAVAQRAASEHACKSGERILVCMDARMQEAYCGLFEFGPSGRVAVVGEEIVAAPDAIDIERPILRIGVGTAWHAYPQLRSRAGDLPIDEHTLPRAREIAFLAEPDLLNGLGVDAAHAEPTYIRDQVAWPA